MKAEVQVADRYAGALFEAARERGEIDKVDRDLKGLAGIFVSSGLRGILGDPQYDPARKRRVLAEVAALLESPLSGGLLKALLRKSRLGNLKGVSARFAEMAEASRGVVPCEVTIASKPDAGFVQSIEAALRRITHSDVTVSIKEDSKILGGVFVRVRNRVLDATLQTRLEEMKYALERAKVS